MMDEVAGAMLQRWCEAKGVTVLTGTAIKKIKKRKKKSGLKLKALGWQED